MRRSFIITVLLVGAALGSLLFLAFRQFTLYGRHEAVISRIEAILFQYSNVREQIVQDIVEGRESELYRIAPAVEELHNRLVGILESTVVPGEYKVSFMQQVDLPGLVLLLRKVESEGGSRSLLQRINEESRIIGERFMLFERLVLGHAKQKLVDFQSVIIGILALVLFLVTTLMILNYRMLIRPVIRLAGQSRELAAGERSEVSLPGGWDEVEGLAGVLNYFACEALKSGAQGARYERICASIEKVMRAALRASEINVLYQSVCRSVLSNPDYVLAWIGVADPEEEAVLPLVADGSSSMSCEECRECFSALLAAQEEENPAWKALAGGETVVMPDVLAEAPRGPFKNTSLAEGRVDSVSLPLRRNGDTFGVLTIYVAVENDLTASELELLGVMAALVSMRAYSLGTREELNRAQQVENIVGEQAPVLSFMLDGKGGIVSAEVFPRDAEYGAAVPGWLGREITEVVQPENESERIILLESISAGSRYVFNARLTGFDTQFTATLEPVSEFPAEQNLLLLVLVAPHKHLLLQPENFRIAYSAAIGEYAGSIAHEIMDMSNGIINYAQMVSDELENGREEVRLNLGKIIREGEKVAAIVEPLLIDRDEPDFTRNMEGIKDIFQEVLKVVETRYRREGLRARLISEPIDLRFRKQHVQLLLLEMLKRAGDLVTGVSSQDEASREIVVRVTQCRSDDREMARIVFTLPPGSGNAVKEEFEGEAAPGMWLARALARAMGGEVTAGVVEEERGAVELLLPV
ncbi:MAG: hypothetical protein Kow0089_22090 [Desulfobulbaceae bacterium]